MKKVNCSDTVTHLRKKHSELYYKKLSVTNDIRYNFESERTDYHGKPTSFRNRALIYSFILSIL